MSSYLDTPDSDQESIDEPNVEITEAEKVEAKQLMLDLKTVGNDHFTKGEYEEALQKYTEAMNLCKKFQLEKDATILLNRAATYLALKRYVPALNDANQGKYLITSHHLIDTFLHNDVRSYNKT